MIHVYLQPFWRSFIQNVMNSRLLGLFTICFASSACSQLSDTLKSVQKIVHRDHIRIHDTTMAIIRPVGAIVTGASDIVIADMTGTLYWIDSKTGVVTRTISTTDQLANRAYTADSITPFYPPFHFLSFSEYKRLQGAGADEMIALYQAPKVHTIRRYKGSGIAALVSVRLPSIYAPVEGVCWVTAVGVQIVDLHTKELSEYNNLQVLPTRLLSRYPQETSMIVSDTSFWVVTYDFGPHNAKIYDSLIYLAEYSFRGNQYEKAITLPAKQTSIGVFFRLQNDLVQLDDSTLVSIDNKTGDIYLFNMKARSSRMLFCETWIPEDVNTADKSLTFLYPEKVSANEIEVVIQYEPTQDSRKSRLARFSINGHSGSSVTLTANGEWIDSIEYGPAVQETNSNALSESSISPSTLRRMMFHHDSWSIVEYIVH